MLGLFLQITEIVLALTYQMRLFNYIILYINILIYEIDLHPLQIIYYTVDKCPQR